MASKLKCPFCNSELVGTIACPYCRNEKCEMCDEMLPRELLDLLDSTRKDLEIAKSYIKGISQMVINSGDNIYIVIGHFKKLAEQTLKQIEHKE